MKMKLEYFFDEVKDIADFLNKCWAVTDERTGNLTEDVETDDYSAKKGDEYLYILSEYKMELMWDFNKSLDSWG